MRRSRLTRALAYLLVLVLLPIGTVGTGNAQQLEQKVFTDEQKSYEIVVEKTQSWDDKYTAKDTVKVAMLDSGVDFTQTINVEERQDFTDCDSEEENPLWDDLTGHGTGVAGLIVSDKGDIGGCCNSVEI